MDDADLAVMEFTMIPADVDERHPACVRIDVGQRSHGNFEVQSLEQILRDSETHISGTSVAYPTSRIYFFRIDWTMPESWLIVHIAGKVRLSKPHAGPIPAYNSGVAGSR